MNNKKKSDKNQVLMLDAAYDASLLQTVEYIFETFPFAWQGKRVLVKPNMLGPHEPEKGVTTHPLLVREVVRQLKKQGAEVMVGDNPALGAYGQSGNAAQVSGLAEAAEGCFANLGQNPVKHPVISK
jgi:uncharacterized protein (DUF362 family)